MTATIRLGNLTATIEDGEWHGPPQLVEMLRELYTPYDLGPSVPDRDYYAASRVVEELGAEMLSFEMPDFDPNVIY